MAATEPTHVDAAAAEHELRAKLVELFAIFPAAVDAGVDVMQVVVDELATAGVELPPTLAMLF